MDVNGAVRMRIQTADKNITIMPRICPEALFTSENSPELFQTSALIFDVMDNRRWVFFTGASIIMYYGLIFWPEVTVWK